jgi:uncharacterized membrane protein YagU involved in acid resistance
MMTPVVIRKGAFPGAVAGLIGSAVLALIPAAPAAPPAAVFGADLHRAAALLLSLLMAAAGGSSFGVLVWTQRFGPGEMLFWGMAYGILKWFTLSLTLLPLLTGGTVAWSVGAAQAAIPGLFAGLLSGAATALALAALRHEPAETGSLSGTLVRGAGAGAATTLTLALIVRAHGHAPASMSATGGDTFLGFWPILLMGVLGGMGFSFFYPAPGGTGPGLIRGAMYGFFWWVAASLTLVPLLAGRDVAWALPAARAHFVTLPGHVLAGAAVALVFQWMTASGRYLFSDGVGHVGEEGFAARGLGLIGRGALAGMVGGLLFTLVMLRINELPNVARLVGASSPWTGFTIHLTIAEIVGVTYGLLFARRSHDLGSAIGWGVSYGFFWWVLGPLTLAPIMVGADPRWTPAAAAALLPGLVGHLTYGAGLGVTFHLLEARHSPWWMPRTEIEETTAARRKEQVLTSAPALWALIVVIALVLPILLA